MTVYQFRRDVRYLKAGDTDYVNMRNKLFDVVADDLKAAQEKLAVTARMIVQAEVDTLILVFELREPST